MEKRWSPKLDQKKFDLIKTLQKTKLPPKKVAEIVELGRTTVVRAYAARTLEEFHTAHRDEQREHATKSKKSLFTDERSKQAEMQSKIIERLVSQYAELMEKMNQEKRLQAERIDAVVELFGGLEKRIAALENRAMLEIVGEMVESKVNDSGPKNN